ncbi:MAG: ZIP family metal transporter [Balneolaceae bacterium]|nr:ZIP family metal transporter [Balneolaceae bacterium]MBO6546807.1 ZIP family metal transporter [Balneolaceae bacterium]MBO6649167.1 ZIP family metal transporter [Balneolaceae bacterium]
MEFLESTTFKVFIYALITALATGIGAIPFFFIKKISDSFLGKANAIAAGLMLSASYNLIFEGYREDEIMTLLGMISGVAFVILADKWMNRTFDMEVKDLVGAGSKKMLLFLGIMTIHSFAEGVSVGVSFANTLEFGVFIAIAIAVHNIPEGLAISLVMVPKGTSPIKAVGWSIFSSLPQPLMAIPAFLFVDTFREYLPLGLGLAAGAMIWMVFAELIPEALEKCEAHKIGFWVTVAILGMSAFQVLM